MRNATTRMSSPCHLWSARPLRVPASAWLLALVLMLLAGTAPLVVSLRRDVPVRYDDAAEHFKYGSIGTESDLGIPRPVFDALPELFEDLLPAVAGRGYERLGFVYEPGRDLPVGTSVRQGLVPLVGLNCAACHTGTLRRSKGAAVELFPGAPGNRFNSAAFLQFLGEVGSDPRFEPDQLFEAMRRQHVRLSWPQRQYYRLVVVPTTKERLLQVRRQFSWLQRRPAAGPGRADTVSPYKLLVGMGPGEDDSAGIADYPPLYNQGIRQGMSLHWDGNNDSVDERHRTSIAGAGGWPASLDLAAVERVAAWVQDLQPPVFPRDRIDLARAGRGRAIFERECADCHGGGGKRVGRVTPVLDVGTDPERFAAFTDALVGRMNALGARYPWRFSHFKRTEGYANVPLEGIWVRSPYLHNGAVPTLRALLFPDERPEVFFRGYDVFDWEQVGYVSSGPDAEENGTRFDTRLRGNHNTGHEYGTRLPVGEKEDLIEYLKTL